MLGEILGDIAGSRFEFSKPQKFDSKTVRLFEDDCFYTDDTVMSVATKYAVLQKIPYAKAYLLFGKSYPNAGYGPMFQQWLRGPSHAPYQSFGNGAAMRVGFIGEYFQTLEKVKEEAGKSAMCTHDHPDGVAGAQAVASCIFLARQGCSKKEIRNRIEKNYPYHLQRSLRMRRPFAKYDITCAGSVPLAIRCFLESDCWESCIRNVMSITCDTDTVGCIAGGIAHAYYRKTGFREMELLKKYLIRPAAGRKTDSFLFDWAVAEG
jgi:ADP-ribosylglycohydrolase